MSQQSMSPQKPNVAISEREKELYEAMREVELNPQLNEIANYKGMGFPVAHRHDIPQPQGKMNGRNEWIVNAMMILYDGTFNLRGDIFTPENHVPNCLIDRTFNAGVNFGQAVYDGQIYNIHRAGAVIKTVGELFPNLTAGELLLNVGQGIAIQQEFLRLDHIETKGKAERLEKQLASANQLSAKYHR